MVGCERAPGMRDALTRVRWGVIAASAPGGSGEVGYDPGPKDLFECVVQSKRVCADDHDTPSRTSATIAPAGPVVIITFG